MTAVAPGKPRVAELEELRLALQEMLGAHRRLRSRDSRVTGAIGFAHYRLLSELRREGAMTASKLAQAADLAPATVTEMLDALVVVARDPLAAEHHVAASELLHAVLLSPVSRPHPRAPK